jgi:excisionase family DNA binding protein
MNDETPEIMTIGEAAKYLRISRSSLYKVTREGRIPCQKVGRQWRFSREALDRWLDRIPQSKKSEKLSEEPTA